ncbi:hypothetical protein EV215_0512 [Hypnocyclicus thermotrophus]|uniref:Uncharacterized protein n=1 Tax=Hypnocyclicus thermotrophus TaxID=1627895 RepID=A0AA46DZM3_9FUSO|nr:hypothetical protein [Hypnocyclicus thermotrophus]TDT71823.1 hypothetical protein EV215_0512 [Hypnocyclicus thermotrophus]
MDNLLIIIGVLCVIISLISMISLRRKVDERIEVFKDHELEYRDLRNDIIELKDEFSKSAELEIMNLDKKMRELNKTKVLIENKIKEGQSLNQILENTFEKINNIEVNVNSNFKENPKYLEKIIIDYYKQGLSIREIAKKTGKTLNEIQMIMGLTLN